MTLEQALQNIKAVCAAFQGNLEQHQGIQQSIQTIEAELAKVEAAKEDKKEVK